MVKCKKGDFIEFGEGQKIRGEEWGWAFYSPDTKKAVFRVYKSGAIKIAGGVWISGDSKSFRIETEKGPSLHTRGEVIELMGLDVGNSIQITNNLQLSRKGAGKGKAFACFNSTGYIYRSITPCV